MSNQIDDAGRLLIEAALRDSRHLPVIMALDRLVIKPISKDEFQQSLVDLKTVQSFIQEHLPESLQPVAAEMFVEHGTYIHRHFNQKGS